MRQTDALRANGRQGVFAIGYVFFRTRRHKDGAVVGQSAVFSSDAGPKVVAANETSHKSGCRVLVHGFWITQLFDVAIEHDGNAVRHRHGFFLIVGDEYKSDPQATLKQLQFNLHLFA